MTVVPIVTDAMVVEEAARSVYCSQNCVAHADVLATWTAVSEFVAFSLKANKVRRARSSPFCLIHPSSLQRRCTVDHARRALRFLAMCRTEPYTGRGPPRVDRMHTTVHIYHSMHSTAQLGDE
jgi:hypothetical protein